jgi:hypothetical protein
MAFLLKPNGRSETSTIDPVLTSSSFLDGGHSAIRIHVTSTSTVP